MELPLVEQGEDLGGEQGYVYLIHFNEPYHHARHYIGFTNDIEERFKRHCAGNGSKLLNAVSKAGIDFKIVRLWRGCRNFERKLKRRKKSSTLCPKCGRQCQTVRDSAR